MASYHNEFYYLLLIFIIADLIGCCKKPFIIRFMTSDMVAHYKVKSSRLFVSGVKTFLTALISSRNTLPWYDDIIL